MLQFLDLFGFLSVLFRAVILALSSVAVAGVVFAITVGKGSLLPRSGMRLLSLSAFGLAAAQVLYVMADSIVLLASSGLSFGQVASASYFIWGSASALGACILGASSYARNSRIGVRELVCGVVILSANVATAHAAARLEDRYILLLATAIHQAASAAWIGGLPYLLLTLRSCGYVPEAVVVCKRFSRLALFSVPLLFGAGLVLSKFYLGDASGLYGTTYGIMVLAKALLFVLTVSLGALNFGIIHNFRQESPGWLKRLSRISEAEIGIGITVILAAASLTSQPPAVDLPNDRVTLSTIARRVSPEIPRMRTPPLSSLSPSTRQIWNQQHPRGSSNNETYIPGQEDYVPPTEGDIAWSEYNHHWAGLVVLVMGALAVMAKLQRFTWVKHWPVAFVGLAVFLLLRADPENWPLGPNGFWESFTSADVTQHRFFVLLILLFAAFEWGVQTGRLASQNAALVFPAVCCLGGAMMLTHTHAISNIQDAFLVELTHVPLALLAVAAGWARWLEIRVPDPGPLHEIAGRVWPVCFALIGIVLLLYREA